MSAEHELMRAGLAVSKGGDEYRLFLVSTSAPTSVPTSSTNPAGRDGWQLYRQSNGATESLRRKL